MPKAKHEFFEVGQQYVIRTVTHYYTGRVTSVGATFVVLEEAAWIADTGRWSDALGAEGKFAEVEPFPNPVAVGLGAIVDATRYSFQLPSKQK